MITFTLEGDPIPWARAERNGTVSFTPAKQKAYANAIAYAGKIAMEGRKPMTGEVVLTVEAWLPIPRSWTAKKRKMASDGLIRPKAKGRNDWDNMGKLPSDALNGILYEDDGQIIDARVVKWYSEHPFLRVTARENSVNVEVRLRND